MINEEMINRDVIHKSACFMSDGIHPCTIVSDRYTGGYSGGVFTAWAQYSFNLPEDIESDDVTCGGFWDDEVKKFVGLGRTPQSAYDDLQKKMKEVGVEELF